MFRKRAQEKVWLWPLPGFGGKTYFEIKYQPIYGWPLFIIWIETAKAIPSPGAFQLVAIGISAAETIGKAFRSLQAANHGGDIDRAGFINGILGCR